MIYLLGPFRLDTDGNLLSRGSEPLPLGRRGVALLRALVERPGALISKEALIDAAWPGQAVEESNLTVQIAALRKVLGGSEGGERWVETMPRRGYRFVGPVMAEAAGNAAAPVPPPQDASAPNPPPPAEAERRQLTVLSCELVGPAAHGDEAALEHLRDAVAAFQRCVAAVAAQHGGHVAETFGNATLVLFGYPTATEHDAEQAVRAGLALRAALAGPQPGSRHPGTAAGGAPAGAQCRIGVATGMAIVGLAGTETGSGQVVGDTPNLAIRLRLGGPPGNVAIEALTRRLIGGLFECVDLGALDAPAGVAPLQAWRVLGEAAASNRFEALRGPGVSRLIGREAELDLLLRLWSRAASGEGQAIVVSGEAGIGKSRLVAGLQDQLAPEGYSRLAWFCSAHHCNSPLFPLLDQIARDAAFAPHDAPAARAAKLRGLAARAGLHDDDVALLLDLLMLPQPDGRAMPDLPAARKKQLLMKALGRQVAGLACRQPLLLVVEDVHWIDPTMQELLDILVESIHELAMLMVVTARPEFQPPWAGHRRVTTLGLNRMDRQEQRALVAQVAAAALPEAVIGRIIDRSDGVPLFVEELTRNVLESGLLRPGTGQPAQDGASPSATIPTTLYGSLLARLDRHPTARLVAQAGAAIGREFSHELIRAVWDRPEQELLSALDQLAAAGLVHRRGVAPDATYSFKHSLIRDAAYSTLLRPARRRLHGLIARTLQARFADLVEDQPELLAWHCGEAGLPAESALLWARAGRRSAARSSLAEAAVLYRNALDQLRLLPETLDRQRRQLELNSALSAALRAVKGLAAPETGQAYGEALALWTALGSPAEFVEIPFGMARYHAYRGEIDVALRHDEQLLHLSRQRDDPVGLVLGHLSSGRTLMYAGRFAESRLHLEALLAVGDPAFHASLVRRVGFYPQGNAQACLAVVLLCLGHPDEALACSNAAVAAARQLGHVHSLVSILSLAAVPYALVGDPGTLGAWADELVAITTEQGFPAWGAIGRTYRGWVNVRNGKLADGIGLLREGAAAFRATGADLFAPFLVTLQANACAGAGQVNESLELLGEAFEIAERTGEYWLAAELHRLKGDLLARGGQTAQAEDCFRRAMAIAAEQGAQFWQLRAATSLVQLLRGSARHAEARAMLEPVLGGFDGNMRAADVVAAQALLRQLA